MRSFILILLMLIIAIAINMLGIRLANAQETIEDKRARCAKDCASLTPDIDAMKACYMEEVNCIIPEKDPAFNELEERLDSKEETMSKKSKEMFDKANSLLRREMALMKQATENPCLLLDNVKEISKIRIERRKIHEQKGRV